jgi:hypothetical protein
MLQLTPGTVLAAYGYSGAPFETGANGTDSMASGTGSWSGKPVLDAGPLDQR